MQPPIPSGIHRSKCIWVCAWGDGCLSLPVQFLGRGTVNGRILQAKEEDSVSAQGAPNKGQTGPQTTFRWTPRSG